MELVRTWREDGFQLFLWDTYRRDQYGKSMLAYRFYDTGRLIFAGEDYHASPMFGVDSDSTVADLLAFLSLGEHDTDAEYFEAYTAAQLEWRDGPRREQLSWLVVELEERADAAYRAKHTRRD